MTKIKVLTEATGSAALALEYTRNLLRGLDSEPENYEYTGEIVDCGSKGYCACGHPIRWGFPLKHKSGDSSKGKIVGSTCVNYFQSINHELFIALRQGVDRLHKQLADAKSASRHARSQAEVDKLAAQWAGLYEAAQNRYQSYRLRGEMAPRSLWEAFGSRYCRLECAPPEYTRPVDYKRWYAKQIARLESL